MMALADEVTTESNCTECASQAGCVSEQLPFVYADDVKTAVEENNLYVEWLSLRERNVEQNDISSTREKEIHMIFKIRHGIRLFETNYEFVMGLIFGEFK